MKYQIINTQGWSWEQLAPYGPDLTAAMKQLEDRFPHDITVKHLALECMTGKRILWLILDENDGFVSFCCTVDTTNEATGAKVTTLTSHAGAEGLECADAMCAVIEKWAFDRGSEYTAAEGRRGWGRRLQKNGYREYAVIWRKPRPIEEAA